MLRGQGLDASGSLRSDVVCLGGVSRAQGVVKARSNPLAARNERLCTQYLVGNLISGVSGARERLLALRFRCTECERSIDEGFDSGQNPIRSKTSIIGLTAISAANYPHI